MPSKTRDAKLAEKMIEKRQFLPWDFLVTGENAMQSRTCCSVAN